MIEGFEKEKENENDDIEEEDPQYDDDETTTEKEIEDFEKTLKADYSAGSKLMNENDCLEMIGKLNTQQQKIFDDLFRE